MKSIIIFFFIVNFLNAGVKYDTYKLGAKPIKFELTLQCEPIDDFSSWKVWKIYLEL